MFRKSIRSVITFVLIIVLMIPFFTVTVSADFENTYSNTGNMRDDIIGVALTQVGYNEGANNYTKYGVWYGQPNSPWCGMFVSWCANEAGVPTSVLKRTGIANPGSYGLSYEDGANYTPQKGDLFFKKNFSHVGFVYYTEGEYFYTVEGNTSTITYDGTSVMIRKRKISEFYFSSPNYSGSSANVGCDHTYETKVENDHPHKEYEICTKCSKKNYTGNENYNDDCKTCIQNACEHNFSNWKNLNDSNHNRICSKCDLEQTNSHNWVEDEVLKEATCVEDGSCKLVCSDCDAEATKTIPATDEHSYDGFAYLDETTHQQVCATCDLKTTSEHTLSSDWDNDSIYHWTSCSDCGGRIRHEEHSFDNGCLEPCAICGFVLDGGHKANGVMTSDKTYHWQFCTRCGQKTAEQKHKFSADCDDTCDDCGYKRIGTAAHTDVYLSNDAGHWSECSSCKRTSELVSHSPDHNTKDWEALHCTHCGYELRSGDNHEHSYDSVQYDDHTHWGACRCGHTMDAEVHSWNIQTGTCSVCGVKQDINSSKDNFLLKIWNTIWNR